MGVMSSDSIVKWGIIGCGAVTEKKSGPAFHSIAGSELVAVMRRNAEAAQDYAQRHGVARWYDRAEALIQDTEVDAIYIATPPSSHAELALKAAAAGKPCYVEKPMACTYDNCLAMQAAFEQAGVPLFVAYYRRALPHFSWIHEKLTQGHFGQLRQIVAQFASGAQRNPASLTDWRFDASIAGGGLFWDLGSHALDLFDFWAGPLGSVTGNVVNLPGHGEVESLATLSAVTETGVAVSASWNFISPVGVDKVQLVCDDATLSCSVFGPPVVTITTPEKSESQRFELPTAIQEPLIQNVVQVLSGQTANALSTAATALRTNRVMDQVAGRIQGDNASA